jgi:hypothetical protein
MACDGAGDSRLPINFGENGGRPSKKFLIFETAWAILFLAKRLRAFQLWSSSRLR